MINASLGARNTSLALPKTFRYSVRSSGSSCMNQISRYGWGWVIHRRALTHTAATLNSTETRLRGTLVDRSN